MQNRIPSSNKKSTTSGILESLNVQTNNVLRNKDVKFSMLFILTLMALVVPVASDVRRLQLFFTGNGTDYKMDVLSFFQNDPQFLELIQSIQNGTCGTTPNVTTAPAIFNFINSEGVLFFWRGAGQPEQKLIEHCIIRLMKAVYGDDLTTPQLLAGLGIVFCAVVVIAGCVYGAVKCQELNANLDVDLEAGENRLLQSAAGENHSNISRPRRLTFEERLDAIGKTPSEDDPIAGRFFCPIRKTLFDNPVVANDGLSYEEAEARRMVQTNANSPFDNTKKITAYFPNINLKTQILEYVERLEAEHRANLDPEPAVEANETTALTSPNQRTYST